ncbi:hypothetical protein ACJMK2_044337 [Sinanodonta woodiana]|uniref:Uncharacterized protein n=1 Tax=Sinanodonta woodiana TaxID=1069815 RepID=A0ABD3VZT2_SINWO
MEAINMAEDNLLYIKTKVHRLCKAGDIRGLKAILSNWDITEYFHEIFNHRVLHEGEWTTPLLITVRNGQENVTRFLLEVGKIEVDTTGTVVINKEITKRASPLWCAARLGNFAMVQLLVENGADVNHKTSVSSTPLHAACRNNSVIMVKYLMGKGADYSLTDSNENDLLLNCIVYGSKDVFHYLLSINVDLFVQDKRGRTPLHMAAENGHVAMVDSLLKAGAPITKTVVGHTPIIVAAEYKKSEVVEHFIKTSLCSRQEKIDALELLGATFGCHPVKQDSQKAIDYFCRAMKERISEGMDPLIKSDIHTVKAYGILKESESLSDLESLSRDKDTLCSESLAVRERILGPLCFTVPCFVSEYGTVCGNNGNYEKCISLWMHSIPMFIRQRKPPFDTLMLILQIFSEMFAIERKPEIKTVLACLDFVTEETQIQIEKSREKAHADEEDDDNKPYHPSSVSILHVGLFFMVIGLKLAVTEEDKSLLKQSTKKLVDKHAACDGYTLLHFAVDFETGTFNDAIRTIVSFPNADLCALLLECGADSDVSSSNQQGRGPLHLIARYSNSVTDLQCLRKILHLLIEHGAHVDATDNEGRTPLDVCATTVAEVILKRHQRDITLKCLAARILHARKIQVADGISTELNNFINRH